MRCVGPLPQHEFCDDNAKTNTGDEFKNVEK